MMKIASFLMTWIAACLIAAWTANAQVVTNADCHGTRASALICAADGKVVPSQSRQQSIPAHGANGIYFSGTATNTGTSTLTDTATATSTVSSSFVATGTASGTSTNTNTATATAYGTLTKSGTSTYTATGLLSTATMTGLTSTFTTSATNGFVQGLYAVTTTITVTGTTTATGTGTSTTTNTGTSTVSTTLSTTYSQTATMQDLMISTGVTTLTATFTQSRSSTSASTGTATGSFTFVGTVTLTGNGTATQTNATWTGTATASGTGTQTHSWYATSTRTVTTTSTATATATVTDMRYETTILDGVAGTTTTTGTNTETLGGVKIGPGITRASDGTISVPIVPTIKLWSGNLSGPTTVGSGSSVALITANIAAAPSDGSWIANASASAHAVSTGARTDCWITIGISVGDTNSKGMGTIPAGAVSDFSVSLASSVWSNWTGSGPTYVKLFGNANGSSGCVFDVATITITEVY